MGTDKAKLRARKYRKRFFTKIIFLTIAIYFLCTQVICIRRVSTNDMFPAIKEGDLVIAYRLTKPTTGDAVIYKNDEIRFGRVVATKNMVVDINGDGYFVDGYHPSEEIFYSTEATDSITYPLTISENEYFVLNDFRAQKNDSRSFGSIKKESIIGKIVFVLRRRGI